MGGFRRKFKRFAKWQDKVRCEALEKISCITDPEAIDQLVELLQHWDFAVRCAAAEALGSIGDDRAFDPILQYVLICGNKKPFLESLKKLASIHCIDAIILMLNNPDREIYKWATDEIVQIGDQSIQHLLKALPDSSGLGRMRMINILVDIGNKDIIDQIAVYSKDDDTGVRYETYRF